MAKVFKKRRYRQTLTSLDSPSQASSLVGNTKNPNVDDHWLSIEAEYGCELKDLKPLYRSRRMDNSLWEICVIFHMIRKPNSVNVLLFIQNISKFLTALPPRRLSLKHLPVSKINLKRFNDFLADTS